MLTVNDPDAPLLLRRRRKESADMDITPMIDIVFLLIIFFLVCSTMGRSSLVQLPKARYGVGINPKTSTVLTLAGMENEVTVYLGDGTTGRALPADPQQRDADIREAVERGLHEGRPDVVIRADRRLHHGEVSRVAGVAASVAGTSLYVIVDDR